MSYHFYRSILTIYTGHSLSETNIFATHGILIHPVPGNFTCPKISLQSTVGHHITVAASTQGYRNVLSVKVG